MDPKAIYERLLARFGERVSEYTDGAGVKDPFFKVKAEQLGEVARVLREDPELDLDFLQCLTAVDWIKLNLFQVVYHLYSYKLRHGIVVKVDLPRDNPIVPSVMGIWPTADWLEREQYDLLGILFTGHRELKRLLMPDDWDGHPMRKDYKEAAEYRGMPTTRYSPLELLVAYDKANPQAEGKKPTKAPAAPKPAAEPPKGEEA